ALLGFTECPRIIDLIGLEAICTERGAAAGGNANTQYSGQQDFASHSRVDHRLVRAAGCCPTKGGRRNFRSPPVRQQARQAPMGPVDNLLSVIRQLALVVAAAPFAPVAPDPWVAFSAF
ncbi:MAG: hypothetical protein QOD67_3671, partial [Caballeronia sp.]|nr:hypothetical protein [Caballeronia sp.]